MKKTKKIIKYSIISFGITFVVYLFWGPLFPWLPFKFGYKSLKYENATIYILDKDKLENDYQNIDELMRGAEQRYDLKYNRHLNVFICLSKNEILRFTPWMSKEIGGYSYETGETVFINDKKLIERDKNKSEYLGHELTHALLQQNTTFLKAHKMTQQMWITEGTAVFFSGPTYYENREAYLADLISSTRTYCDNCDKSFSTLTPDSPIFTYTFYGDFVNYLYQTYGSDKFNEFLKTYIKNPENYREDFANYYGSNLDKVFDKYYEWATSTQL